MICYTLSDCVLRNINTDSKKKEIRTDLLGVFTQERSPHKIVVDRTGKIIEIYNEAIDEAIGDNNPAIFYWLQTMADFPQSWEPIDVDNIEEVTSKEEVFLKVCSHTEDKMLIVYHHNGWTKGKYYHKRSLMYKNVSIRVLDRNETMALLSLSEDQAVNQMFNYEKDLQKPIVNETIVYDHSIVSQGGSNIHDAKITENGKKHQKFGSRY